MEEKQKIIPINNHIDLYRLMNLGKEYSNKIGFNFADQNLIATALSELGTNILRYAKQGEIIISIILDHDEYRGLKIIAHDQGPGIKDIDEALKDNYSTNGSLGLGLPSVKRMMDEFTIESTVGIGTKIIIKKWKKNHGNH